MEDKGLKLEESELRQGKLGLQFEGLLDCIDSTRDEILGLFQEVQDKDKKIGVLESQVEAKSEELRGIERLIEKKSNELESLESSLWDCQSSIEEHNEELSAKVKRLEEIQRWVKEKEREYEELCGIERLIEEKSNEVESLKSSLHDFQSSIKEHNEELSAKEKRVEEVQRWVSEKEREYDSIKKRIEHGRSKLNWYEKAVEKKSKLVESKEEKLKGVLRTLGIYNEEIEFQKKRLNEIRGSIEEQKEELALKKEQTKEAERKVDQCDRETKDKEKKLSTIQKSIEESSKKIESREKIIDEMDLKVKDFFLLKKSMEEWSTKLELKEREFESKVEDLTLIQKKVDECVNEVQLKEQHLDSLEKLIREGKMNLDSQERLLKEFSNGLELKERQLEEQFKELELKRQDIDSIQNSTHANSVIVSSSTSNHFSIDRDGGGLQLLMKESVKRIDLLSSDLAAFLQASSDPAKLVLDAMQGFYRSNSIQDNKGFDYDLTVIRRSCVLLLQELKRLSPPINPPVREQAIKLVDDWKEKMTVVVENSLEVLGLLWLLTAFELTSTYDARELQSLLALVSHPEHAPQLRQALGITYNASGFIRDLIERKQLIKAVRLICTFKLTDRFPPVVLLNNYVEDLRKSFRAIWPGKKTIYEKDNVMNNLIADLRGVLQCIKGHNLESEYPYKDIELEIVQLERLKENLRFLPTGIASRCEQQEQERRKRCSTSSTAQFQPPEKRQNRGHPTALAAAARSYTTFRSQLNPSSQLFGNNDGHPGQFSMFANHYETGCSSVSEQLTSSSQLYEIYGHPLQFAMDHEIGANFGPMQLRSSSQLAENFGFPVPLPLASNEHEIGTDFSCMQDAGLYNSNQLLPGNHGFGRRET